MLKKEILMKDEETMDLEYDLLCDFIKFRHDHNLTQDKMSKDSGVMREVIAAIETRRRSPQVVTLIKLLKPYGYTIGIKKIEEGEINESR